MLIRIVDQSATSKTTYSATASVSSSSKSPGTWKATLLPATVSRDAAGYFYVSFIADRVVSRVKGLIVASDSWRLPVSDRLKQKEQQLRWYQRSQPRKLKVAMVKAGLDPTQPIAKGKGCLIQRSTRFASTPHWPAVR